MTAATPSTVSYEPRPMTAPKPSWSERINLRMVIFFALVVFLIGAPVYIWLQATISGGVINHGSYSEVDLKAMSLFDMDQYNATTNDIPERWRKLEGKRVLLEGEMYAPNSSDDDSIGTFQLVYSRTKCCFSGPPLAQHFVDTDMLKGVAAAYYSPSRVRVLGTLHIRLRRGPTGKIESIYHLDAEKVTPM